MKFGLYIHWPFCIKKCPYCDFNSYTFQHDEQEFINTLLKEMQQQALNFSGTITTIFFGGGTPSLIMPANIKLLIEKARELWKFEDNLEITIEMNPSSVETHKVEKFLEAGINRISIGIQSLKDDNLQFLGRLHSANEAKAILTHAASVCDNVSADFMYALPNDNLNTWKSDLNEIIELIERLNLKHCSMYELVIEEKTAFAQAVRSNQWLPMQEDLQATLYFHTFKTMKKAGWNFYEISNASKQTHLQSQHNLIYWRYQNYLGIGPGAHSRMMHQNEKIKFQNAKNPFKWARLITSTDSLKNKEEFAVLNEFEQFQEKCVMGLRLTEGIEIRENEKKFLKKDMINVLVENNLIQLEENRLKLSLKGRLKMNSILAAIIE